MAFTYREQLERKLQKSSCYFIEDGDGWSMEHGPNDVHLEADEQGVLCASVNTGIPQTAPLRALENHLGTWAVNPRARIARFETGPDGCVRVVARRSLSDRETPDQTARIVGRFAQQALTYLQRVADGEDPFELIERERD